MHWSWQQLAETPIFIRHRTWEFLQARREAEARAVSGKKAPEPRKSIADLLGAADGG